MYSLNSNYSFLFQFVVTSFVALSLFVQTLPAQELIYNDAQSFNQDKNKLSASDSYIIDQKSQKTVVLIHGLTDSLYYMKDVASLYAEAGYNVLGLLLDGHGGPYQDLAQVHFKDWRNQLETTIKKLKQRFPRQSEVHIAGFSTGGLLALDYVKRSPQEITSLFLLAPSLALLEPKKMGISRFLPGHWVIYRTDDGQSLRHTHVVANGVKQLVQLIADYFSTPWSAVSKTQIMALLSNHDDLIHNKKASQHIKDLGGTVHYLNVGHTALVLKENPRSTEATNPYWFQVENYFKALQKNLTAPTQRLCRDLL